MKLKFIILLLVVMSMSLLITVPTAKAADSMTKNVIESGTIQEGVTYEKFSSVLSHEGSVKNEVISYVKKEASAANVRAVVWAIRDNGFQLAAIDKIAEDYEKKHPGEEVLAIINGDYFYTTDGSPVNREVIEGEVNKNTNYSAGSDKAYVSLAIDNENNKITNITEMTYENNYVLTIYDKSGKRVQREIVVSLNEEPNDIYQTAIYFNNLQALNSSSEVSIYEVFTSKYNTTNPDSYVFGGLITNTLQTTGTTKNYLTICSKDPEIKALLDLKPRFKISKAYTSGSDYVIGAGSQPLVNNRILSYSEIKDNTDHEGVGTTPRSTIGITANGDMIICAIDGRQSSKGMYGVTVREEAYVMQQLGCVDCYNLDGGGSTQLYLKKDDTFKALNSPSETKRYITNAILFVQKKASANLDYELTGTDALLRVNPISAKGVEITDTKVYWNEREIKALNGNYAIKVLPNVLTNISVEMTYTYNGVVTTETVLNKRIIPTGYEYICINRGANKTELNYLVSDAMAINQSEYVESSVNNLVEAINNAKTVSNNDGSTQTEVSSALEKLQSAINSLVKKGQTPDIPDNPVVPAEDKTKLQAKVDEAKLINKIQYTTQSCQALQAALNEAQEVLNNENATQEEVDNALEKLTSAINNMEKIGGNEEVSSCFGFNIIEIVFTLMPVLLGLVVLRKGILK